MNSGNGYDLVSLVEVIDESFLALGPLCLWANKEKPKYQNHQSQKDELKSSETGLSGRLQQIERIHKGSFIFYWLLLP
jgi:hypothetical protein